MAVCTSENDFEDVNVLQKLWIFLITVNYAKEYKDRVFNYFLEMYEKGFTPPNPRCIV